LQNMIEEIDNTFLGFHGTPQLSFLICSGR